MNRCITLLLFLCCIVLTNAQPLPRHYIGYGNPQIPFIESRIQPLLPTPDGGYLLNIGYSFSGLHRTLRNGHLIKLDADLNSVWRRGSSEEAGHPCYINADGSILHFTSHITMNFFKLQPNGGTAWVKSKDLASYREFEAAHVHRRGANIVVTGTLSGMASNGYPVEQDPVQFVMDTLGNILSGDSMDFQNLQYNYIADADNAPDGSTYLVGHQADWFQSSPIIARLDTNHTLAWAFSIDGNERFDFGSIQVLANGDLLISGQWTNVQNSSTQMVLARVSSSGNLLWIREVNHLGFLQRAHEMPSGAILAISAEGMVMRFTGNGNLVWAKQYPPIYGLGTPLVRGPNDWLVPGMGTWPFVMETDSNMVNGNCPPMPVSLTLDTPSVTFTVLPAAVYSHQMQFSNTAFNFSTQVSVRDSCFGVIVGEEETEFAGVEVFPNPSCGRVNVRSEQEIEQVEIWNAMGEKVGVGAFNGNEWSSELQGAGLFFMRIRLPGGEEVVRKVVNLGR